MPHADAPTALPLPEIRAALSLATDLAMGHPLEFALCGCVLAMRLGDQLGLTESALHDVYYEALLRYVGCNAETYAMAAFVGDELALGAEFAAVDAGQTSQVLGLVLRYVRQANDGANPLQLARALARGALTARGFFQDAFAGHCEVAQRLAGRFGFGPGVIGALGQLYERWDGRGLPGAGSRASRSRPRCASSPSRRTA